MVQSPPVKLSVVMQQIWFKSCWGNRMSTVCVSTILTETSRFVPCPTLASSSTGVTSGREQDFLQSTFVLRAQTLTVHNELICTPHALVLLGPSPQPWFRDLLEFKPDEFSPYSLDFPKHPGKLYDPVRADLHPLS